MQSFNEQLARLQDENRRLRLSVEELSILNDIATAISSTLSLDKIIDLIVHKCVKHFNVEQSAIMLVSPEEDNQPFRTMIRGADRSSNFLPFHLDTQLAGWILKHKQPLLSNDIGSDNRFKAVKKDDLTIHSLLSVPLLLKGIIIGFLNLFNKKGNSDFNQDDQRLLSIIAAQSAQVIEIARLHEEELNFLRLQEEMRLARQIQINLLPAQAPKIENYDLAGKSIAAQIVGGDYYDFIPVDDSRLALCIGDVSGKGMPAALLMSNLQATLRAQTLSGWDPAECIKRSNHLIFKSTDLDKYATLFYCILDFNKHELLYTNAGHDNPLYFKTDGNIHRLQPGGIVVGFLESFDFTQELISLDVGDTLVLYSDGITEAMNEGESEFGEDCFIRCLKNHLHLPAAEMLDKVILDISKHCGKAAQWDDMTLVVLKRNA